MLSKGRAFVRDLLSVFEKLDGGRSNCPRCRGTGLLRCQKSVWPWSPAVSSNAPCWFCEGMGAMPLYGLEGFFLGRASTLFRTKDLKRPVDAPVELHLCLGKYPETRCTLKSSKPSRQMEEVLDTQSEPTFWSLDAARIPGMHSTHKSKSFDRHHFGEDTHRPSQPVSTIPSVVATLDPAGIFFHHDFDISGGAKGALQLPVRLENWYFQQKDTFKAAQRTVSLVMSETNFGEPACVSPVGTSEEHSAEPAPSGQREESGHLEHLRGVGGTARKRRSVKRNQLRDKAEREAAQRALRRKKLNPAKSSETPAPSMPSGPVWSQSGSWQDLSSAWLAEATATARRRASESSKQKEADGNL